MSLATLPREHGECPHCGPATLERDDTGVAGEWLTCLECGAFWETPPESLAAWWRRRRRLVLVILALLAVLLLLAGCGTTRIQYVDRPVEVIVERKVYVDVPDELVPVYPIATGPLSQCPIVASDRRLTLEQANANSTAIRAIRGTDVPTK